MEEIKKHILDLNLAELKEWMELNGEKKFRAIQVLEFLYKNRPLENSVIPKDLILKLNDKFHIQSTKIIKVLTDSVDGTQKFLFKMFDSEIVEGVLMKYHYGNTFCISTQVGCRMGCKFCASTKNGLKRNLTAGEMLEMFCLINGENRQITNLVLMGIGEPLDNYDNVIKFLKILTDPKALNISARNISLSTCGVVPGILKLADESLAITLSLSLHSTVQEKRMEIMPISKAYPLKEVLDAIRLYQQKTGRRIAIEYTLIKGINDKKEDVLRLKKMLAGVMCFVNVIVLNKTDNDLRATSREDAYKFMNELKKVGLSASLRRNLGSNIEGACGQLRAKFVGDKTSVVSDKRNT